ncbi:MAG: hypothetical protein KDH94_07905, partial [Coxiellaceae bacterium]|nr:hypothetical protein [Coxiellaceae bacterium]
YCQSAYAHLSHVEFHQVSSLSRGVISKVVGLKNNSVDLALVRDSQGNAFQYALLVFHTVARMLKSSGSLYMSCLDQRMTLFIDALNQHIEKKKRHRPLTKSKHWTERRLPELSDGEYETDTYAIGTKINPSFVNKIDFHALESTFTSYIIEKVHPIKKRYYDNQYQEALPELIAIAELLVQRFAIQENNRPALIMTNQGTLFIDDYLRQLYWLIGNCYLKIQQPNDAERYFYRCLLISEHLDRPNPSLHTIEQHIRTSQLSNFGNTSATISQSFWLYLPAGHTGRLFHQPRQSVNYEGFYCDDIDNSVIIVIHSTKRLSITHADEMLIEAQETIAMLPIQLLKEYQWVDIDDEKPDILLLSKPRAKVLSDQLATLLYGSVPLCQRQLKSHCSAVSIDKNAHILSQKTRLQPQNLCFHPRSRQLVSLRKVKYLLWLSDNVTQTANPILFDGNHW